MPPPGKAQWVLRVERHAAGFGQQTHFRIERASPDAPKAGGGAEVVWLRARATGGYVNYRGENFVRGHGNRKKAGGGWSPAERGGSSQMIMEAASLAALAADRDTWRAPRQQCLAPSSACESEIQIEAEMRGAPLGAPRAAGMTRACHAHYAGVFCDAVVRQHGARPGVGWGQTPAHARLRWARLGSPTPTLTLTPNPSPDPSPSPNPRPNPHPNHQGAPRLR